MSLRLQRRALIVTLAALASLLFTVSAARAAGTPDISATINSPTVLHGSAVPVTVTARNPAGQPYGYNLSYRVVLPPGVTYSGGAETAPRQISGPRAGETTLIFRNVSDLSPNATNELAFDVAYDTSRYDVGSTFPIAAQAFVNDRPRYVPLFDANGQPSAPGATSYTGYSAAVTGTTTINAIDVEKDEPSAEGEILRGVHDHQTVYTVSVRNNGIRPTTDVTLVDFVPAGLEFLGCGGPGADNTTNAPTNPGSAQEYPGSGPIVVAALAPCTPPQTVETVTVDPDGAGPLPNGVYTRVEWAVGTLANGERREFRYRAAVPIRENTMTWTGATPARTGAQATNLDNNSGPETRDEQALVNQATASGRYNGTLLVRDETTLTRTAEDWVVHKSASGDDLVQGGLTTWTLDFETSEYRSVRDATVTDTLPNGLCPLGATNLTRTPNARDAECDPVGGQLPTAPYTSATENADGTWTITWDSSDFPALAQTDVSDRFTLRFPTRTRSHYQSGFEPSTPILTRDAIDNRVRTEGTAVVRCLLPGSPDCTTPGGAEIAHDAGYGSGTTLPDASSAGQVAASPRIDKRVAASGANCAAATYVETIPTYHPGDRVCWNVRVNFPAGVDTSPQAVRDFLPAGATYETGSDARYGADNVTATIDDSGAADGVLAWTISGGTVPRGSRVFEHVFSTIVEPPRAVNGEVLGNLQKFSSVNTAGASEPLRDQVDIRLETPVMALVKGVQRIERGGSQVGAANGPNVDGRTIQAGDRVTYRIDVTNSGGQDAVDVEVWDILPREYDCTLPGISGISDAGTCSDELVTGRDRIKWSGLSIAAGATKTLTYTATVPADIGADRRLDNTAGIRGFAGETNRPGVRFPYTPANNIDPDNVTTPNAPAADDPSWVTTSDATVAKTGATSVTEGGNSASQATIGETITYTVTARVPAGTTLGRVVRLTDTLDSATRQRYVVGSESVVVRGTSATYTVDTSGTTPSVRFDDVVVVPPGSVDATVELRFDVIVTDVAANTRTSGNLTNRATLTWTDAVDGAQTRSSPTVNTQIVEPLLSQAKRDDLGGAKVLPGDFVTYTVTTTNGAGSPGRVSVAHEVLIADVVPIGLTPVDGSGNRLADGATIPGRPGVVWNEGTRTISTTVATIAPGASAGFTYRTQVDDPAVGGSRLTNVVTARTQSLPTSGNPDRRDSSRANRTGYEARASNTIGIRGATIAKSVTPARLTVGEVASYELLVTIPADIELYDVTVTDVLPDALAFVEYGAVTCVSGPCPFVNDPLGRYDAVLNGNGTTTIAWDFGDIVTPLATPLVMRVAYRALLRDRHANGGANVVRGETAVNTAEVGSNSTNRVVGPFDRTTIPSGFEERTTDRATVTAIEPSVSIDKQVKVGGGAFVDGPATARSDDALAYQLVIRNSGDAPARDVVVTDLPDAELTDVTLDRPLPSGVTETKAWTAGDRRIGLAISELAAAGSPGDSVTVTYRARLVAASNLSDGQAIDNTAAVPSYFGVDRATRQANPTVDYREYRDGGDDSTRVVLDFPTLTLDKTTGLASFPDTGSAEVGRAFPWRVVVRNTSATATASDVVVSDTLPRNWTYDSGSATVDAVARAPVVTSGAGGDRLDWTVASIAPGQTVVIAFTATPAPAAADDPGLGPQANVNSALVSSARDEAGNTGNRDGEYRTAPDTATATLRIPALTIDKTPDAGSVTAGEGSSFTIEVRNNGLVDANNVVVTDVLPRNLVYEAGRAEATPRPAGFTETVTSGPGAGETTVVWRFTQLRPGDTVSIRLPVTVAADVADGTPLVNTAGVRSDETPREVTDRGRLDVRASADLHIVKDGPARYVAGTEYTWSLDVTNRGPSDAQAVVVSDTLPAGVRFVSADAPCRFAAGAVSCALATLAARDTRTFAVTVSVDADRIGVLRNTASVSSDTDDPTPGDNEDSHDANPDPLADVTVVKTAAPEAIARGHQSTFTLTVSNRGPSVARDVRLQDVLPSGLRFVSVDDNRCTESSGTIDCALGDLAVGTPVTLHVTVTGARDGDWTNTATVTTTTPEPQGGGDPNSDDATVVVGPVADLGVVKDGPATVAAGGQLTWNVTVTNHGGDAATGVVLTDTLPSGVTFAGASEGCTQAGGTVTCAIGALAVGESATRQITVTVPTALGSATIVNTAVVDGDQIDENPANDRDDATTTVGPSSDLAIVKSGPATAAAGGTVAWTLVATNNGPSAATGVVVADALPQGVTFVSATPAQGTCSAAGQQVTCTVGALAAGASTQIQVVGQVSAALENATVVNVAAITGEQPDPNQSNNRSEVPTRIGPPSSGNFDLVLRKSVEGRAAPVLGGRFTYALQVTNSGPATATNVTVTDTLPRQVKGVSATVPGGRCTLRGALVTCRLGSLRAGESRTIAVRVTALAAGRAVRNAATVRSDVADRDPSNDRASATTAIGAGRATLRIAKTTLGRARVAPGGAVRFRVTVANTSTRAAADVVVCDRLPEALSLVSTGGGRLRRGDLCWTVGLLPGKASRTFDVTMRVSRDTRTGTVRNVAIVTASNAASRRARAGVVVTPPGGAVLPGFGRGGGVTG